MKEFISEDFLLQTESARRLYHDYAEGLPIIDYHCHLSPEYVADNHVFPNLSRIWLEGEAGNFPAAIKVTAEYFPKRDHAFATSLFNAGATVGALIAPLTIPSLARYFKDAGIGNGWEMAFVTIGALGFVRMGL